MKQHPSRAYKITERLDTLLLSTHEGGGKAAAVGAAIAGTGALTYKMLRHLHQQAVTGTPGSEVGAVGKAFKSHFDQLNAIE